MKALRSLYWVLSAQLGVDPVRTLQSLRGLPRYVRDMRRFRRTYRGPIDLQPCLFDWSEEGGATRSEYFWQDLLVARMIFAAAPEKHVDVGSRVDGFVSHVASFREIEVFDVRPLTTHVPGVTFRQADLMSPLLGMVDYCDSLSCLHALEHFGLGRYGDPIDPLGYERGLRNMAQLVKPGGTFYLAVPSGRACVKFNAHRVFDPRVIVSLAAAEGLELRGLTVIDAGTRVETPAPDASALEELSGRAYALGIFVFVKNPGIHRQSCSTAT